MNRYLITLLILLTGTIQLAAQDFIELDGKKIPKKELNPYSGLGYEVDLTKPENKPNLKSAGIGKNMKITSQRVFAAKGMKSFLQSTVMERADSASYYLPSSDLKFFDEKGKLRWQNTTTECGNVIVKNGGNLTLNGATINLEGNATFTVELGGVFTVNSGAIQ